MSTPSRPCLPPPPSPKLIAYPFEHTNSCSLNDDCAKTDEGTVVAVFKVDKDGERKTTSGAKKKLFATAKRDHNPSGETPYPQDKLRLVSNKILP